MTIRIHPLDDDDQARERHELIVKRLDELGVERVIHMQAIGALPTGWVPIIVAWLKDKAA